MRRLLLPRDTTSSEFVLVFSTVKESLIRTQNQTDYKAVAAFPFKPVSHVWGVGQRGPLPWSH